MPSIDCETGQLPAELEFALGDDCANVVDQRRRQAVQELVGVDLLFKDNTVVTPAGDYRLISGLESLKQSIYHRLVTDPGEFKLDPTYGCGLPSTVKKPATRSRLDELKQRILENLRQDDRIQAVEVTVDPASFQGGSVPGIRVAVRVKAFGQDVRFQPFDFAREV